VKGLDADKNSVVQARKCRRYYGTATNQKFNPTIHKESESHIDHYDGVKRAMNMMEWLLKKGQDLSTTEERHAATVLCNKFWPKQKRESTLYLFASDASEGPMRSTDKVSLQCTRISLFLLTNIQVESIQGR